MSSEQAFENTESRKQPTQTKSCFVHWHLHIKSSLRALHSLALVGAGDEAGRCGVRLPKRQEQLVFAHDVEPLGHVLVAECISAHVAPEQQAACFGRLLVTHTAVVVGAGPAKMCGCGSE